MTGEPVGPMPEQRRGIVDATRLGALDRIDGRVARLDLIEA